jgi:FixJ family two-component response regulator
LTTQSGIVAIVEDDAGMRRAMERLLDANGFGTAGYNSAEAFLQSSATDRVVCLVVDIQLGGMSGIMLRRRLAASGSTLPVIFVTAIEAAETEREAIETGCVAYLRKPFASDRLIAAVKKATGHGPSS